MATFVGDEGSHYCSILLPQNLNFSTPFKAGVFPKAVFWHGINTMISFTFQAIKSLHAHIIVFMFLYTISFAQSRFTVSWSFSVIKDHKLFFARSETRQTMFHLPYYKLGIYFNFFLLTMLLIATILRDKRRSRGNKRTRAKSMTSVKWICNCNRPLGFVAGEIRR